MNAREATFRGWRTLVQGALAAAIYSGAEAVIAVGGTDLASMGKAFGVAALAAVLSYAHNLVSGRKTDTSGAQSGR